QSFRPLRGRVTFLCKGPRRHTIWLRHGSNAPQRATDSEWRRLCKADLQSFRPLRGRVTFLCKGPKKSNQKKGPFPRGSNSSSLKCSGDFPTRHPWLGRKTAHILCAALRVCT